MDKQSCIMKYMQAHMTNAHVHMQAYMTNTHTHTHTHTLRAYPLNVHSLHGLIQTLKIFTIFDIITIYRQPSIILPHVDPFCNS